MRYLDSTVRHVLRIAATALWAVPVFAQQPAAVAVSGRVLQQGSDAALANTLFTIEGRDVTDLTIRLASNPLAMNEVVVTADRNRQVGGELGTGSVIDRDAIRNLGAASLAGVLELVPGSVLQPPGLDGSQQVSLRTVPVSPAVLSVGAAGAPRRSAQQLAAFGTQIIIDDIPVSNNANLQSLGPRAELSFSSVAGGGVDLRRIPAATLERVEVVRGIASSRYGDLTSGVVLVETRAGRMTPDLQLQSDPQTVEASSVGGVAIGSAQTVSAAVDATRTRSRTHQNEKKNDDPPESLSSRGLTIVL